MREPVDASATPDGIPEPSAALAFAELLGGAFIRAMPPTMAIGFVRGLAEEIRDAEDGAEVITMAPNARARYLARRQALAELRHVLPALVAMITLPPI